MSIYGNTKRVSSNTFQFDRIYPNRRAMDMALASGTDGVYAGRYVLVEYGERYERADPNADQTLLDIQEINGNVLVQTEDFKNNAQEDMNYYGVTYDSTVWQKVYISDDTFYTSNAGNNNTNVKLKQRFILVAELNALVPRMETITEDTYTYGYDPDDKNKSLFIYDNNTNKYVRLHNTQEDFNPVYFDQVQDTELTYYLHLPSALQLIAGQEDIDYNDDGFNAYIYTSPKNKQSFIGWVPSFANSINPPVRQLENDGRWVIDTTTHIKDRQVNKKTLIMNLTAFGDAISEIYNVLYGKPTAEGSLRPYFANRGMSLEEARNLGSEIDLNAPGTTIDTILANNSEGLAGVLGSILTEKNPYTGTSRFFLYSDWTAEGDITSSVLNTNTPTILNKPKVIASNEDTQYKYNYWIDANNPTEVNLNTHPNNNLPPLFLSEIEENGYLVATNQDGKLIRSSIYTPQITEEESLGHYKIVYDQAWELQRVISDPNTVVDEVASPTIKDIVEYNINHNTSSYNIHSSSSYTIPGDPNNFNGSETTDGEILFNSETSLKCFNFRPTLPISQSWKPTHLSTFNINDEIENEGYVIKGFANEPNSTYAFSPILYYFNSNTDNILRQIYETAEVKELKSFELYIHVTINNYAKLPILLQAQLYKLSSIIAYTSTTTIANPSQDVVFVFDLLTYFNQLRKLSVLDENNPINFMVTGITQPNAGEDEQHQAIFSIKDISYVVKYPELSTSEDSEYYKILDGEGYLITDPLNYNILDNKIVIYKNTENYIHEGTFLPYGNNYCFNYDQTINSIEGNCLLGTAIYPQTKHQFVALKLTANNCPNIMENIKNSYTNLNLYIHVQLAGKMEPFVNNEVQVYLINPTIDYKFTAEASFITFEENQYGAYFVFNLYSWIDQLKLNGMFDSSNPNELIGYIVITGRTTQDCSSSDPGYIKVLDISYEGENRIVESEKIIKTLTTGVGVESLTFYEISRFNNIEINQNRIKSQIIFPDSSSSNPLLEGTFLNKNDTSYFNYQTTLNNLDSTSIVGIADNPNTQYLFTPLIFTVANSSALINAYLNEKSDDGLYMQIHILYGESFEGFEHGCENVFLYTPIQNSLGTFIYQANSIFSVPEDDKLLGRRKEATYRFHLSDYLDNLKYLEPTIDFSNNNTILFYIGITGKTGAQAESIPGTVEILNIDYTYIQADNN